MSEFVFKNLSVKVVPDQGARFCSDESVTVLACTPCTDLCTGTVPVCDDGLTDLFSDIGRSFYGGDPYIDFNLNEFRIYNGAFTVDDVAATQSLGPDRLITRPPR